MINITKDGIFELLNKFLQFYPSVSRSDIAAYELKPRTADTLNITLYNGEKFVFVYRADTKWLIAKPNMLK